MKRILLLFAVLLGLLALVWMGYQATFSTSVFPNPPAKIDVKKYDLPRLFVSLETVDESREAVPNGHGLSVFQDSSLVDPSFYQGNYLVYYLGPIAKNGVLCLGNPLKFSMREHYLPHNVFQTTFEADHYVNHSKISPIDQVTVLVDTTQILCIPTKGLSCDKMYPVFVFNEGEKELPLGGPDFVNLYAHFLDKDFNAATFPSQIGCRYWSGPVLTLPPGHMLVSFTPVPQRNDRKGFFLSFSSDPNNKEALQSQAF